MKKPVSRQLHGAIDYAYAAIVPFIPEMAGFSDQEKATLLCRLLGGGALTYTMLTKAEWGVIKLLPFKTHLMIDLSVSIMAIGAPWLLGFSGKRKARNAVIAIGVTGLIASLFSENKNMKK
jgi:hypothetical protein